MKIIDFYAKFNPKQRTGKECKQTGCGRHSDYLEWKLGNSNLKFCMKCKYASVSQYKKTEQ